MRTRFFASVILFIMLFSNLGVTVSAAGVFPYADYEKEGYYIDLRISSDYDTERGEVIYPQGFMYKGSIEYKGNKMGAGRNKPLYDQIARVSIRTPEGFTEDLGTTVFYHVDWFTTFGQDGYSELFDYEGAGQVMVRRNGVAYSISHESEIYVRTPENRTQTVEEAIEKQVEYWEEYFKGENNFGSDSNQAEKPVSVERGTNYVALIGRMEQSFYKDTDNSLNAVKVYGFSSSEEYSLSYHIYYVVPELKGVYFEVSYGEHGYKSAQIEDKDKGEYQKYYTEYEKIYEDHKNQNYAKKLLNVGSLMDVTWEEPIVEEGQEDADPVDVGVTQSAADTPGEDDGVDVSEDIVEGSEKKGSGKGSGKSSSKSDSVKSSHDDDDGMGVGGAVAVGVLSTGAAVGAGAAAASSSKGKNNNGKKKKSYKMYVQKDFGDAIRRGADPVKIRARMAEVDENGNVRDRNDLTALISVSGEGMTVHDATMAGRYCEATVSVPLENQDDTASIIFIFNGEGGTFTNTVVFRLIDGASLKFVEETERAGTYHLYHSGCGIEAIPGDNFTYTRQFMIVDAIVAPKLTDIKAVNTGEFDVKFEMTDHQYVYKMIVKNNTKPEPEHDIFAKVKEEHFEIHVTVEGEKEPVIGYVTMEMYPEGITISSDMEGKKKDVKYVRVQAFEKENVGDFDKKWQVSQIKFTLAFKGKDKAIIDPEETKFKFAKLKGACGLGMRADKEESLAEKYQYKEAHTWMNDKYVYEFEPQAHLCEPSDGTFMMVLLPVTCTYESVKHEAEIPLRLRGKDMDPMENWEEEYKKLRERLEKYSLPAEKDKWLERIENMATDPRASVEELRLTSKMLVRNYMRYWEIEGIKSRQDAELYDNIINQLEWAKFFGDCAFSFLVNAYAGPVAEAILSPTKDFLTEAVGETIASWSRGQSVDFDKFNFSKNVLAAGDNLVSGQIGFDNWKKAAYTLGAYFAYASLKNFYMTLREDNKFDLYGALVKGFSDMTSAGLKAAASHLFDAWLKNNVQFRKKMSIWCGQFVTKHFGAGSLLLDLRNVEGITKSEIVRKYLDGLFGMAIDKLIETDVEIHNQFITSENGFEIDQNGHVIIQFFFEVEGSNYDCKIDATQAVVSAASGLFGYVFELLFGEVPFASSVIEMPTDPPLPPEK